MALNGTVSGIYRRIAEFEICLRWIKHEMLQLMVPISICIKAVVVNTITRKFERISNITGKEIQGNLAMSQGNLKFCCGSTALQARTSRGG